MSPISDFREMYGFEYIYSNLATRPSNLATHPSDLATHPYDLATHPSPQPFFYKEETGCVAAEINFLALAMRDDLFYIP
jgi:hypothetical protein